MILIKHNLLKSDIFLILYLFQVFQGLGFSGWGPGPGVCVQVLEVGRLKNISHR